MPSDPGVASQLVDFGPGDPLSMPQTLALALSPSGCGHLVLPTLHAHLLWERLYLRSMGNKAPRTPALRPLWRGAVSSTASGLCFELNHQTLLAVPVPRPYPHRPGP